MKMLMASVSRIAAAALLGGCAAGVTTAARAETLIEALTAAYKSNPTLSGARARQRGVDENVALAKADGRPAASLGGTYNEQIARPEQLINTGAGLTRLAVTPLRSAVGQGSVSVPLYSGGTVRNAIHAAERRVEAGQNDLRGTEASVFANVVGAYMDVIRDSQIASLNLQNVKALEVNLRASKERFEVGDLTRTDVAQSESRLALARATAQQAQAQLVASRENYNALVGHAPEALEDAPPLAGLPATAEAAVSTALADNPDIRSAQKSREAARYDIKVAEGAVLPRISAFVQGNYTDYLRSENTLISAANVKSAQAGASLTIPLYQGGRPGAAQRQAVASESAAIDRSIEVERGVVADVRATYARWQAALQNIEATRTAVSSAELSLEGVKAENSVGSRTILDILNAEQEALNARVQLVSAQRDAYVAAFGLLASMGHAQASDLAIDPAILYDPQANYRRVRGKIFDFDFDKRAGPSD